MSSICPRCEKSVYAAEQVMGPGRKMYHKSCLKCTACNKRLDSGSLLEHDSDPYCKSCHVKNFSTKSRHTYLSPPSATSSPVSSPEKERTYAEPDEFDAISPDTPADISPELPTDDEERSAYRAAGIPSTPPSAGVPSTSRTKTPVTPSPLSARYIRSYTGSPISPMFTGGGSPSVGRTLSPISTGNSAGGTPRWGGARVECPRCEKAVFFAEQINAVGKKWHKACLRCTACAGTLDPNRLADKDGEPYCRACYSKLHGPQGAGYALLGKAGA